MYGKPPIWGNETTLPKTCLLSVFERGRHRNTKMNGSHLTWGIQNNIAKNVSFGVFEILTNQNAKTHAKPLYDE